MSACDAVSERTVPPPEGRRGPELLDVGIAVDAGRIGEAAARAARALADLDPASLARRRDDMAVGLGAVPDGWALMYAPHLERMRARASGLDATLLDAGLARIEAVRGEVEAWWAQRSGTAGELAAVEGEIAWRRRQEGRS